MAKPRGKLFAQGFRFEMGFLAKARELGHSVWRLPLVSIVVSSNVPLVVSVNASTHHVIKLFYPLYTSNWEVKESDIAGGKNR